MSFGVFGVFSGAGMGAAAEAVTPVAFGTVANGGTISPLSLGALVGDLIMVSCPHETGGVPMTLSGGSWAETAYTWYIPYNGRFAWKVLSTLSDITVTGNNYGAVYAICRGPTTAAIVVSDDALVTTSHTLTFPSKNAACIGIMAFGQMQAAACNLNPPSDWSDRFHAYMTSVFAVDVLDNLSPPSGSHDVTFTGTTTGDHYLIGVELRA